MKTSRLKTIILTIGFCYLVVLSRLFYWQIIKFPELYQKVVSQNYKPQTIVPSRGKIFDVNNHPLVLNHTRYLLSLYKPEIADDLDKLIDRIHTVDPPLSTEDTDQLNKLASNQNIKWITLKYFFNETQKQALISPGIKFNQIYSRYYPENTLAKEILGITSIDSMGNLVTSGGLESYYQKQLKGRMGFAWETTDATGKVVLSKSSWQVSPVNGRNLHTSINRQIQFFTENILEKGVNQFSADSGSITIMEPDTGAIISMASFTATSSATPSATKNAIISDLFEPGSIFKPLVVSMAIDTKAITNDYICTKCHSPHQIGQYSIGNWDNSLNPNSSIKDIIKNSDNIGMSYIIQQLGIEKFSQYFNLLGLTKKTGIDLQGETKPIAKNYWPEIDLATASFGQGFAITQIQMLQAFNVIANNGKLSTPHLVNFFDDGENIYPNKRISDVQIFKSDTTQFIKDTLKYAVENGVVAKLKPSNLDVCAKSGTAQIAVTGGYSESSTIASYVGFSPCNNPKFTMIVTINNPKSSPWGSSTAAPIWFEIASKLSSLL